MKISLNTEQQLYVLSSVSSVSCFGFDNAMREAIAISEILSISTNGLPESGTIALYDNLINLRQQYAISDQSKNTWFDPGTDPQLRPVLEDLRISKERIRIFLGDLKTGECWLEENDVVGRIGRSMGPQRALLLLATQSSLGGGAISTSRILRIQSMGTKAVTYQHPKFQMPTFTMSRRKKKPSFEVSFKDSVVARFKSDLQASHWIEFMRGERMKAIH